MTFALSERDNEQLKATIGQFLVAHKSGEISIEDAQIGLTHMFSAARKDEKDEFLKWLKPSAFSDWFELSHATGP
jgi:hypothetical protein